jgi:hypothetical protein
VRQNLDPFGPAARFIDLMVDLGQHSVQDKVIQLFLVAHVAVQRAGNHSKAGREGTHAQCVDAVGTDDNEGLGDDAFAGKGAATFLIAERRCEPQ